MADRTRVLTTSIRDLSSKNSQEIATENYKNQRVRQLVTLRIYHQNKIKDIDSEMEGMLKDDVGNIDY